jgi:hypothetical protein
MSERDIFLAALEIDCRPERAVYLERACSGDPALRERLDALLAFHEQENSFLNAPYLDTAPTADVRAQEGARTVIGRYKILEKIGEGGFAVVFMAEQTEPVRRRVALKIIKPGMDSQQVIGRFEAERQALALMDHPNIAKVFDGVTGPASGCPGRPYFVMELVNGHDAVRKTEASRRRLRRDLPDHPRRPASHAFHTDQHTRGATSVDCPKLQDRACKAPAVTAR